MLFHKYDFPLNAFPRNAGKAQNNNEEKSSKPRLLIFLWGVLEDKSHLIYQRTS